MKIQNLKAYWYLKRRLRKFNCRAGGHSQYGQDLVALDLLKDIESGIFIDIGANDGVTLSNSLLFEELGWKGICVEPHPTIFKQLQKNRKCDCLNACITDQDGFVDFLVVEGSANMLSGIETYMDAHHKNRIKSEIEQTGGSSSLTKLESITPETMLERFGITQIDFLSVDTEGCELPILQSFNLTKFPAKVISVENGTRSPDVFRFLTSVNYRLKSCVGCDEVYVLK